MTRIAFIGDIHGRRYALEAVIRDARSRGAQGFVDLGDVGTDACHDLLRQVGARGCFGNYEVSQWDRLSAENQLRVHSLPPIVIGEDYVAAHATPAMPGHVCSVNQMLEHMLEHGLSWKAVFPRMHRDLQARWLAYAELLEREKRIFLHGHTHVQTVWRIGPNNAMSVQNSTAIRLEQDAYYLIGIGSVGQPKDSTLPSYALYDSDLGTVILQRVQI